MNLAVILDRCHVCAHPDPHDHERGCPAGPHPELAVVSPMLPVVTPAWAQPRAIVIQIADARARMGRP